VRVQREAECVRSLDLLGRVVRFDAESGARVSRLLEVIDGHRSIAEIANKSGMATDEVAEAVGTLYQLAVLRNASGSTVPALVFYRHMDAFGQALQVKLVSEIPPAIAAQRQQPTPRLFLGDFVEAYHFIMSAPSHMGPTLVSSGSERLRMMWSEYLAAEYWHGLALREGLLAGGIAPDTLESADPLPATLAIINTLRWLALTDVLAYCVCGAGGEQGSGPQVIERINRKYDRWERRGIISGAALSVFKAHELEDATGDHHSYLAEPFAEITSLTGERQNDIRRKAILYHRTLLDQVEQIVRFYGDENGPSVFSAPSL
jgi:hypothetical protein